MNCYGRKLALATIRRPGVAVVSRLASEASQPTLSATICPVGCGDFDRTATPLSLRGSFSRMAVSTGLFRFAPNY